MIGRRERIRLEFFKKMIKFYNVSGTEEDLHVGKRTSQVSRSHIETGFSQIGGERYT